MYTIARSNDTKSVNIRVINQYSIDFVEYMSTALNSLAA